MYFNKKYKGHGHVFQSVFKASRVADEAYLLHITRYIHMNPRSYLTYRWSSIGAYLGRECESWLKSDRLVTMTAVEYKRFLVEYEPRKEELEALKIQLAG